MIVVRVPASGGCVAWNSRRARDIPECDELL